MNYIDLVESYIESKHGTSVSRQFVDTYSNDDFESANINALCLIKSSCDEIIKADMFVEETELIEYTESLTTFLTN